MKLDLDRGNFHTYCKRTKRNKFDPVNSLVRKRDIEVMDICFSTFI